MRHFVYTVFLPGQKKTISIKELYFNRYKHLVKNILNGNDSIVAEFFDDLLTDLCLEAPNVKTFSFLDKIIILLTIRAVCLSPVLELTATCPSTGNQFNNTIQISNIVDKLQNLNLPDKIYSCIKEYNNKSLIIDLGLPDTLNVKEHDLTIINTFVRKITLNSKDITDTKNEIIDHLPAYVLKDIRDYISEFNTSLKDIDLISLQSPFAAPDTAISIPLNLFSNSVIEFLKICFKRNLISFYEIEYFLTKELNVSYELIKNSTPAELNIYINLYKDERAEQEKQENKKNLNLPVR